MNSNEIKSNSKALDGFTKELANQDPIQTLFEAPRTTTLNISTGDYIGLNSSNGVYYPKFIRGDVNSSNVSDVVDKLMSRLTCRLASAILDDISKHHDLKQLGIIDPSDNLEVLREAIATKSKLIENRLNSISSDGLGKHVRHLGSLVCGFDCTGMWLIASAHPEDDDRNELLFRDHVTGHGLVGLDFFLFLAHKFLVRHNTSPYNESELEHYLYLHEDEVRAIVSRLLYERHGDR